MFSDLRLAWRNHRRRPAFAAVAVASTALGIAAAASIFSFADAILFAPLPFPNSDRVMAIVERERGRETNGNPKRLLDWGAAPSIEAVAGYYGESFTLTAGELPERVPGARTFGDFLGVLNARPALGRGFTPLEQAGHGGRIAVISDALWRRVFAADRFAIGRPLHLNGQSFEVIGVLAAGARLEDYEIFTPEPGTDFARPARFIMQIARLRAGAPPDRANAELRTVAEGLGRRYPQTDSHLDAAVRPLRDALAAPARFPLLLLLGAVGFLLLLGCLNAAGLLLARNAARQRELAVRRALGAGRWRIARLLIAESLLLAAAGGAIGLGITAWAVDLLRVLAPPEFPRLDAVAVNPRVALFAAATALAAGLLTGLIPGLTQPAMREALAGGARATRRAGWLQPSLLAAQIALSLVLAAGGALLFRSLWSLESRPLGFSPQRLLSFRLSLPWQSESEQVHRIYGAILERLRALPEVEDAALTDRLPLAGGVSDGEVAIAGRADLPAGARVGQRFVSPGFHAMMRTPLLRGRFLGEGDASGPRRCVINSTAARLYFAGRDPLGQSIALRHGSEPPRWFEIVGVVGDLPRRPDEHRPEPSMYLPYTQGYWPLAHFVVRTRAAPEAALARVRAEVAAIEPARAVELAQTVDEFLAARNRSPRLQAWLVGAFGAAALLLCALGLYGLAAERVQQRRAEFGIRMALGAWPSAIARGVVWSAARVVAPGLLLGLAGAAAAGRWLASRIYGVAAFDGLALTAAALLLTAAALTAILPSARRAARLDPMSVLRND